MPCSEGKDIGSIGVGIPFCGEGFDSRRIGGGNVFQFAAV